MAVCQFHQDRPAIGVCVRCRRPICAACSTRLDGVNHCRNCLERLATPAQEPRSGASRQWMVALALLAGAWLLLFGVAWLLEGKLAP